VCGCCFVGTCFLRYPLLYSVQHCHLIQRGGRRRVNGGAYIAADGHGPECACRQHSSHVRLISPVVPPRPPRVSVCASMAPTEESMEAAAAATAVASCVCRRRRPRTSRWRAAAVATAVASCACRRRRPRTSRWRAAAAATAVAPCVSRRRRPRTRERVFPTQPSRPADLPRCTAPPVLFVCTPVATTEESMAGGGGGDGSGVGRLPPPTAADESMAGGGGGDGSGAVRQPPPQATHARARVVDAAVTSR